MSYCPRCPADVTGARRSLLLIRGGTECHGCGYVVPGSLPPAERIAQAAAKFPATFGLRGHEGVFRISLQSSYVSDTYGVQLYTEKQTPLAWVDFAKGSPEELAAQVVAYSMTVVDTAHDQAVAAAAPAAPCRICRGAHPTPERPVAAYGGWCCPTALDEARANVAAKRSAP